MAFDLERYKIFDLTKEPTSDAMLNILERLHDGENVSRAEIEKTPEMIRCRQEVENLKQELGVDDTAALPGREDINIQVIEKLSQRGSVEKDSEGKVHFTGEISHEQRMDVVIGLPGSGKSSAIVETLSTEQKARVVDNDEAKKELDEFRNGYGAGIVHEESSAINKQVFDRALQAKENIIVPKIGSNGPALEKSLIKPAAELGYKVYVHYVDVSPNTSLFRILGRMITDGRFVDYKLLDKYLDDKGNPKTDVTYDYLKDSDYVEGYSRWDNEVDFGQEPILSEHYNTDSDYIENREPEDSATADAEDSQTDTVNYKEMIDELESKVFETNDSNISEYKAVTSEQKEENRTDNENKPVNIEKSQAAGKVTADNENKEDTGGKVTAKEEDDDDDSGPGIDRKED